MWGLNNLIVRGLNNLLVLLQEHEQFIAAMAQSDARGAWGWQERLRPLARIAALFSCPHMNDYIHPQGYLAHQTREAPGLNNLCVREHA